jgi:transcription antitermination factor NusG
MSSTGDFLHSAYSGPSLAPIDCQPEGRSWYAILTRARNERVVSTRLQEREIESYLPVTTELHTWKDRKKRVEVPLFSCYVFVRAMLTNQQRFRVCNLDGVFGFVGPRGEATPIPDEQIEAVRTLLSGKLECSNYPFLKVGQRVRIRGGAMDGIEGVLQARNGERTLIVSIDAIQRSLAVRVEGYHVEPI